MNGEFNVDLCQFWTYRTDGIGANNGAYCVSRPARAIFGQCRQIRLCLACKRQENLNVCGGGVGRVIAQVRRGEGDTTQVRGNIANGTDCNQVGCA
ncbi:hypothetical protein D3C78_1701100 [compost metagenome]